MKTTMKTRKIELVKNNNDISHCIQPFPYSINECKRAFTTRNVPVEHMQTLVTGDIKPQAGDLVLCEVTRLRQHCRIELANGRRSRMFVRDKIIVCYGHRYAPDQFESIVPDDLDACHLVAGGGIASHMREKSNKVKPATQIQPLGLIANKKGEILNLKEFSILNQNQSTDKNIPIILVAGSSMNAGKTTTVASIIKGLTADGFNVGAAKVTGTGSGGDLWHFIDAGVKEAIDFTDAGFATTYKMSNDKLIKVFKQMLGHLSTNQTDAIVVEVADGILQSETRQLLQSKEIQNLTTAMVYTAGDSSSAVYGAKWLKELDYQLLAVSGVVSSNPLGKAEVESLLSTPVLKKNELTAPGFGFSLMETINGNGELTQTK